MPSIDTSGIWAPVTKDLEQQGQIMNDTLSQLFAIEQKKQAKAEQDAELQRRREREIQQDARQQKSEEEAKDLRAFQFTLKTLQEMEPETQHAMITRLQQQPDSKFMRMYREYTMGNPDFIASMQKPSAEDQMVRDAKARAGAGARLAADPQVQEDLFSTADADRQLRQRLAMQESEDSVAKALATQKKVQERETTELAAFITGQDPNLRLLRKETAQTEMEDKAAVEKSTAVLQQEVARERYEREYGTYVDEKGTFHMATRGEAIKNGWKNAYGAQEKRPVNKDPIAGYRARWLAYKGESDAASNMELSQAQKARMQVNPEYAKSLEAERSQKIRSFRSQKLPLLVNDYVTSLMTANPDFGASLSVQLDLVGRYVKDPKFRQSKDGQELFHALIAAGEGRTSRGAPIPVNPLSEIVKDLPPEVAPGSTEEKFAQELYNRIYPDSLKNTIETFVTRLVNLGEEE